MASVRILLNEHVGRIFERLLRERGYDVEQARDRFGEHTKDAAILEWCVDHSFVPISNNAKDFEPLHREHDHADIFLFFDQKLPDADPEGLARTVDEVVNRYGQTGIENQLVDLDGWYNWLRESFSE